MAEIALRRLLETESVHPNDLTTLIENCDGKIETKKYSDDDIKVVFDRGRKRGAEEEATKQQAPPEFYDADGQPRWNAIALFCQKESARLRESERNFVDDMAGNTLFRQPTEKQAKWLLAIFVKFGGYYEPKSI
jgi:hypothetical protein